LKKLEKSEARKEGTGLWFGIALAYAIALLALPTLTGFFFALWVLPGLQYLPVGLIAFADLAFSYFFLRRSKFHIPLSQGLRDAIKLNIFLGILAWTFYFMPAIGPIVGKLL
jgi:hypothetical protein